MQAMNVADRQRVFRSIKGASRRIETEERPIGGVCGQQRRAQEAGDGGKGR
jgi:hypothetical protein